MTRPAAHAVPRCAGRENMNRASGDSDAWGPGEFLRLVAAELTGTGLDARLAACDGSFYVTVGGLNGVHCEVTLGDRYGSVACQYWPHAGVTFSVMDSMSLAVSLLTGEAITGIPGPDGRMPAGDSLMSVAGRELKARGFDVWLDVDTSQLIYQAVAELVVTNPGGLEYPKVVIAEDGSVTWAGMYRAVDCADAGSVAAEVAAILTRPLAADVLGKETR